MTGGLVHRVRRWVKLHTGRGRAMREAGARIDVCPFCDRQTPVYETEYGDDGTPLTFSVCLWCDGHIEWPQPGVPPREAYRFVEEDQPSRNR